MEHWLTADRLCGAHRIFCTHSPSVAVQTRTMCANVRTLLSSRWKPCNPCCCKMAYPAASSSGSQPTAKDRGRSLSVETNYSLWFEQETSYKMPEWWPPSWFCQVVFSKWPTANFVARLGNGPQPTMGFIFDCISGLPLSLVLCGAGVPGDSESLASVAQQVGVWCVCV